MVPELGLSRSRAHGLFDGWWRAGFTVHGLVGGRFRCQDCKQGALVKIRPTRRIVLATVPAGATAFAGLLAFAVGAAATPAATTAAKAPAATAASATTASGSTTAASAASASPGPAAAGKTTSTSSNPSTTAATKSTGTTSTGTKSTKSTGSTSRSAAAPNSTTKPKNSVTAAQKAAARKAAAAALHTSAVLSTVNGRSASSATVIHAGDVLAYRVSVRNTGTAAATVKLTETVPNHTTYAATVTAWKGCTTGAAAHTTCTQQPTLAAGESGTTTFTVRVVDPLPGGVHSIADTVRASSGGCSACTARNATAANLHTKLKIDSVNGHAASTTTHLAPGDDVRYTVSVSNNGGSAGTTTVHDPVPAHATFSGSGWSCGSGASDGSSCTKAFTVGAGSTVTASYRVTLTSFPGDTKTITVAVSTSAGTCSICSVSNRTVAHLVTTKEIFRVGTGVVDSSVDLRTGDRVVYHITVTNTGGSTGGTTLADTVPAHTTYVGKGQGWSCPRHSGAGTSCTQTVSVGSGGKVVLRYTVLIGSSSGAAFSSVTNSVTTSDGSCAGCTVTNHVAQEGTLANTGIDAATQSGIGVGLLGFGALLTLAGRRRRTL